MTCSKLGILPSLGLPDTSIVKHHSSQALIEKCLSSLQAAGKDHKGLLNAACTAFRRARLGTIQGALKTKDHKMVLKMYKELR